MSGDEYVWRDSAWSGGTFKIISCLDCVLGHYDTIGRTSCKAGVFSSNTTLALQSSPICDRFQAECQSKNIRVQSEYALHQLCFDDKGEDEAPPN